MADASEICDVQILDTSDDISDDNEFINKVETLFMSELDRESDGGDEEGEDSGSVTPRSYDEKAAMDQDRHIDRGGSFIDLSNANRRVRPAKVPDFFASRLQELEGEDLHIGTVYTVPSQNNSAQARLMIRLDDEGIMEGLPRTYALRCSKPVQQLHMLVSNIINDDEAGEEDPLANQDFIGIQGKVEQECMMVPMLEDSRYRELIRERTIQANKPKRTTQMLDSTGSGSLETRQLSSIKLISDHALLKQQSALRKRGPSDELRRERLPRTDVMNMLFRVFESYGRLSFNDLVSHTQQPAPYLKEILADITAHLQYSVARTKTCTS